MNDAENKNPNQYLITVGIFLIVVAFISAIQQSHSIIVSLAILVRILVLLWIPMAAKKVKRDPLTWTLFALLAPPIAFISLGVAGYPKHYVASDLFQKYNEGLKNKLKELKGKLDAGEINKEQYSKMFNDYKSELEDFFNENYHKSMDDEEYSTLNNMLKNKGYVLDENSDVFVEVGEKCPACGAKITGKEENCPECGLTF